MSGYDDNDKGAIWKNEKRDTDRHPHFTGQATVGGVDYWVSAWKRDADAKERAPALRFAFKAKDEQRKSDSQRSQDAQRPGGDGQSAPAEFDDEIPF